MILTSSVHNAIQLLFWIQFRIIYSISQFPIIFLFQIKFRVFKQINSKQFTFQQDLIFVI